MSFNLVLGCMMSFAAVLYGIMILAITAGLLKKSGNRREGYRKGGYSINNYFSQPGPQRIKTGMDKVSVIIPVRNEAAVVTHCLDGLVAQDYPHDFFEIIVSDDFSEDYTVEKVRRWARENQELKLTVLTGGANTSGTRELKQTALPGEANASENQGLRLTVLTGGSNTRENQGKKKAIERAVAVADGSIILCTDADTSHGQSWITSVSAAFGRPEIKMVLGPVCFTGEKGMFQKIQVLEFLGIMGVTAGSANLGFPLMCNGANLAYRKQAFDEAGGFIGNSNFNSGDDQFLLMKFRKQFGGKSIIFHREKSAITLTAPCKSWNDFLDQRIRWVSKSRGYMDAAVIIAGLLTFGFPFLILAGGISGLFNPALLLLSILLWFLKILVEYPMVWKMAGFFEKKHLLSYYFAAQLFQFFYSIPVALAGQFSRYSWKGRKLKQ